MLSCEERKGMNKNEFEQMQLHDTVQHMEHKDVLLQGFIEIDSKEKGLAAVGKSRKKK